MRCGDAVIISYGCSVCLPCKIHQMFSPGNHMELSCDYHQIILRLPLGVHMEVFVGHEAVGIVTRWMMIIIFANSNEWSKEQIIECWDWSEWWLEHRDDSKITSKQSSVLLCKCPYVCNHCMTISQCITCLQHDI